MKDRSMIAATTAAIVTALVIPSVAQAQYLDPGAGSILVQVVIAAMVGVTATVKIYWNRISAFLERRKKKQ